MKLLFVTSEAAPFAASGGLGDVMGALPHAIAAKNPDYEVGVILPFYSGLKEEYRLRLEKVIDISFMLSWRSTGATVYRIKDGEVSYFFVENHNYFDRGRLYGEFDDAERFAFFSRAVVEYIKQSGNIPDILHANDWQTALSVIYLKTEYKYEPRLSDIKTVFTIHNIEYQGRYDPYILGDVFGLDNDFRSVVEYDGDINLMKGAIVTTDYLTTVSPTYARELQYDYFAFGLADVIKANSYKMSGIINGIDYGYFSPEEDKEIVFPYGIKNLKSGKGENKLALQKELGLKVDKKIPMIAMVTRLTAGKGIDLVLHIMDELVKENVQIVILGTGESAYEASFEYYDREYSNVKALIMFDRALSKRIYAACDMFLMPSKSEPCGLAQMIACSYGAVPIVHSVGGLFDSIKPCGTDGENGFTFSNFNAHEMLYAIKNAISMYSDYKNWNALARCAKRSDFSWERSADKYIDIYNSL